MNFTTVLIGLALVIFGYLAGSLSPSVFLGKIFQGKDLRQYGSGNAGTANAFRVLGPRLGLAVLFADLLKGGIPVLVARLLFPEADYVPYVVVLVALACVLGHNYSLFLRGKGGKGVATGAGAAIAMMPLPMAVLIALYLVLLFSVRIVSVASITCTVLFPVMAAVFQEPLPYIVVACLMSVIVLWAHRGNMKRLWQKTEPQVSFPWNKRNKQSSRPNEESPHSRA
ncbi:MAG: glycerol-3-phosphate 1-O-acyltransferase PlsY [Thermoleophilia bacterium]|nr:glycerol-3-phosphate 1-O-acyltransferase PlsY [Thermoleophilia bacterium]